MGAARVDDVRQQRAQDECEADPDWEGDGQACNAHTRDKEDVCNVEESARVEGGEHAASVPLHAIAQHTRLSHGDKREGRDTPHAHLPSVCQACYVYKRATQRWREERRGGSGGGERW